VAVACDKPPKGEREDRVVRYKLVSSLIYIVSYLCGKSRCLTLTRDCEEFGAKGLGGIGR